MTATAVAYLALGEPLYRVQDSAARSGVLLLVGPSLIAAFSGAVYARRARGAWARPTAIVAASAAACGAMLLLAYLRVREASGDGNKWECWYCPSAAEQVVRAVVLLAAAIGGATLIALAAGALAKRFAPAAPFAN